MKALRQAFQQTGGYARDGYYIFLLDEALADQEPDAQYAAAGDMPRGKQFGYVFMQHAGNLVWTIAHELGHGIFTLQHSFDNNYSDVEYKGKTGNLMDYANGTELAVWQWKVMANPAPLTWFDTDEDGMGYTNDSLCWNFKRPFADIKPARLFANKKVLEFDGAISCNNREGMRTYYRLTNGDYFLKTEIATSYELLPPEYHYYSQALKAWYQVRLDDFESDCLSCSLSYLAMEANKAVGRYLLPLEDMYILFEGEDFDGNEASRVAAGGFLVLEVVQARKFLRFIRSARILTRAGSEINTVRRILWTGAKSISKDAAINMSAQFVVNFVATTIKNPDADGQDIVLKAIADIDVGSAVWGGVINYTSLTPAEQFGFDCAYRMFLAFEKYDDSTTALGKGMVDCGVLYGLRYILKYLRNTDTAKQLARDLADARQYDIVMQKLSTIMNADQLQSFVEALAENGIQKGVEPLWAK